MKFIKLTNVNEKYKKFYLKADLIIEFSRYDDICTVLDTKDIRYTVKETPEEILKMIEEAK